MDIGQEQLPAIHIPAYFHIISHHYTHARSTARPILTFSPKYIGQTGEQPKQSRPNQLSNLTLLSAAGRTRGPLGRRAGQGEEVRAGPGHADRAEEESGGGQARQRGRHPAAGGRAQGAEGRRRRPGTAASAPGIR